ncbi:protocadherin-like wing polarity protein stan [Saccostrea echinata]|uniref:protocadherin-like wing polarity protein stan n=1 Tax=Saccostrea echinata TaxID=191078 RepID=UPI002A8242D3|nr:protocadherin-like wing polarity protein stan [Saccostrea echinata]
MTTLGADPVYNNETLDNNTGTGYLMTDSSFTVGCCGVLVNWKVFIQSRGSINLQIWRPEGSKYKLIGENIYSFDSPSQLIVQSLDIPQAQQVVVKQNDVIGWYSSSSDMVPYKSGAGSASGNYLQLFTTPPTVGTSYEWSTANFFSQRSYAVQSTIDANVAPTFKNLPATKTFQDKTPATTVMIVTVTDDNSGDVATLSVSLKTHTDKFEVSSNSVAPKAGWTWSVGTFDASVVVTDQCGNSGTETLTIVIENTAPDISYLPSASELSEVVTSETKLGDLSVTDVQTYTCSIYEVTPSSGSAKFILKQASGSSVYSIYSAENPNFVYSMVSQYKVNVTCTDVYSLTSWGEYTVNILPNKPPVLGTLPATQAVSAKTTTIGTEIFSALATDTDSSQIFYNKTCSPNPCPFEIFGDGKIKATEDLMLHKVPTYDMHIYAYDGRTLVGPGTLTININDINHVPVISNIPTSTVTVPENTAVGTEVFTVQVTDQDPGDTHTYTVTYSPAEGGLYLTMDANTGVISVKDGIDYESLRTINKLTYDVTIIANDGRESSTSQQMTIIITDVNEQQTGFVKSLYTIETGEGKSGNMLTNPFTGTQVLDPDFNEVQTFTMDCGANQGKFSMDPNTGSITQSVEYDLDSAGKEQEVVTCTVTATDKGGHTVTTQLSITINEINDNAPVLDKGSYSFFVSQCSSVGSSAGQVTATDKDVKQEHKDVTFTLTSGTGFLVGNDGTIHVAQDLCNVPVGTKYDFTLTAVNADGLQDTAPVSIVIRDPTTTTSTTTTTTTTTTAPPSSGGSSISTGGFFDNPENLAWFIPAVLLAALMMALFIYFLYKCFRHPGLLSRVCCKKKTSPRHRVKEPEKINGKYEWNVWSHSDYTDNKIEMR